MIPLITSCFVKLERHQGLDQYVLNNLEFFRNQEPNKLMYPQVVTKKRKIEPEPGKEGDSLRLEVTDNYQTYKDSRFKYFIVDNFTREILSNKEKVCIVNQYITSQVVGNRTLYSCKLHNGKCSFINFGSRAKIRISVHIERQFFTLICSLCNSQIKWRTAIGTHFAKH